MRTIITKNITIKDSLGIKVKDIDGLYLVHAMHKHIDGQIIIYTDVYELLNGVKGECLNSYYNDYTSLTLKDSTPRAYSDIDSDIIKTLDGWVLSAVKLYITNLKDANNNFIFTQNEITQDHDI